MKWRQRMLRAPDEVVPGAPTPPAAPASPPPAPPPAAPASPPPPAPAPPPNQPPWLAPRLAEERRKAINEVVAKLGLKVGKKDSPDVVLQQALDKLASGKEKRKALKARVGELESNAQENASLKATIRVFAESEMAGLPENVRASVKTVAGDDHVRQLETIASYRLAGLAPATPAAPAAPATPPVTPPAATQAAPPAAPATTATPPATPPSATAPAPAPMPAPTTTAPPAPGPLPTDPNAPMDIMTEVTRLGRSSDARDRAKARLLILQNPRAYADASAKARTQ